MTVLPTLRNQVCIVYKLIKYMEISFYTFICYISYNSTAICYPLYSIDYIYM